MSPEAQENELLKAEVTRLQEELRAMTEKNRKLEEENEKDALTGAYNFPGLKKMARVLLPREKKKGRKKAIPARKKDALSWSVCSILMISKS